MSYRWLFIHFLTLKVPFCLWDEGECMYRICVVEADWQKWETFNDAFVCVAHVVRWITKLARAIPVYCKITAGMLRLVEGLTMQMARKCGDWDVLGCSQPGESGGRQTTGIYYGSVQLRTPLDLTGSKCHLFLKQSLLHYTLLIRCQFMWHSNPCIVLLFSSVLPS